MGPGLPKLFASLLYLIFFQAVYITLILCFLLLKDSSFKQ